jgi:hypothetical protein
MARKKQTIEEIIEKDVAQLGEREKVKKEELSEIQKELRRYEAALDSLKGNAPSKKRKREVEVRSGNSIGGVLRWN